jgi:hypothetical protein
MNRQITKRVNVDALAALKAVATKHGLVLSYKGGKFDSDGCELKYEFAHEADGQSAVAQTDWETLLKTEHGLKGVKLGDKFRVNGTTYTISSCKLSRPVWPISGTGPKGGKYRFKVAQVEQGLR